ncbi:MULTISPECIES: sensor histidine kinase [Nocardiopsis]|uniref:histidine kinase n=3 Tax=Nocardiopsis TaxID=2013 RepID=D7B1N8_NOCDD|nr:ATP-binding protein [Nocardiopsis dassonvillei]ADH68464.1 putative sensor with HAMP domain [Nocardiopsis dassonvillei subsp. dassonvillei DSM 43111]NKY80704.1 ATP-binding protein [Nocardiopsis dassonvillei]VEI88970.1 sensor protein BasS/PmrB [Nocardiopsis dassonvillei]
MGNTGGTGRSAIRAQINRIVLIPSITFLALFVVLSTATLVQAVSLRSSVGDGRAGIRLAAALTLLQEERRLSAAYLADPAEDGRAALSDAASRTDEALVPVHDLRGTIGDRDDPATEPLAEDFFTSLTEATELRAQNLAEPGPPEEALTAYTTAIGQGIRLYAGTARSLDNGPATAEAAAVTDLMWAQESFSRADALIAAVLAEDSLDRFQQAQVVALTADARHRVDMAPPGPAADDGEPPALTALAESRPWQDALAIADTLATHEAPVIVDVLSGEQTRDPTPPEGLGGWREAADQVNAELADITATRAASVVTATEQASSWMLTLALGGSITSLFAGTLAYGVAARSAGRLTHRLAQLRADTLGSARSDLPRIVRRLESGEQVDLDTEMKQLDHGDDEVGQVADAFNIAQRTAVAAAVKQADIRAGVNRVFLGIAHRHQSLLQRQLQLLDRVEREEEDPDLLESLFQLDHLATRGRRHAENLIILGGAQPGRRWRHPVPLVDILRGAISETEEYTRVRLTSVPDLSLSGAAVADVIHMLAELVENATAYSPPHTQVTIATESVPKGVAVEIEDRGLGMTEEVLTSSNRTLSEAPEFDVMTSGGDSRLGLFVVARLAAKHDIRVQLRHSPYGGTRAVVLIPGALVASSSSAPERPRAAIRQGAHSVLREPSAQHGDALTTQDAPHRSRPLLRPVPRDGDGARPARGTPLLRRVPAPVPDSETADAAPGTEPGSGRVGAAPGRPGLPRRRRQASLAPQLRAADPPEWDDADPPGSSRRTPEQARQMMDAFSAGTRRGRAADIGVDADGREHSSDGQVGASADDHTGESD